MIQIIRFKGMLRPLAGLTLGVGLILWAGCSEPPQGRMNAPPQGYAEKHHNLHEFFTNMTGNAMLTDMSMSAAHFFPNTSKLNSLGTRRLEFFSNLLSDNGGEVHYDGAEPDANLRGARVKQIEQFLLNSGLAPERFNVKEGLAGGGGMGAAEALQSRKAAEEGAKSGGSSMPGFGINLSGGSGK